MEPERYRIFIWQKVVPLIGVPVFAALLLIWPVTQSWSRGMWIALAVAGGAVIVLHLATAWRHSLVRLDDDGVTLNHGGIDQTWPWDKITGLRQFGAYRVRLCVEAGGQNGHTHISVDMWHADAFCEAIFEWREHATGRSIAEAHEPAA
jgi:hypothetical protein